MFMLISKLGAGYIIMGTDDIQWNDWCRILNGNLPWTFLCEVILRGVFLYLLLFFSMRLMGRRMAGQLSRTEMAALVSLAATVGIPMQSPEKGLLPALVSALVIIALHSLITRITFKNHRLEQLALEEVEPLVKDGCLQQEMLKKNAISKELIFSQLRGSGIKSLGCVQRLYYEPAGAFSLQKYKDAKPGLSLLPSWDKAMTVRQSYSTTLASCEQCGLTRSVNEADKISRPCANCGKEIFTAAAL